MIIQPSHHESSVRHTWISCGCNKSSNTTSYSSYVYIVVIGSSQVCMSTYFCMIILNLYWKFDTSSLKLLHLVLVNQKNPCMHVHFLSIALLYCKSQNNYSSLFAKWSQCLATFMYFIAETYTVTHSYIEPIHIGGMIWTR